LSSVNHAARHAARSFSPLAGQSSGEMRKLEPALIEYRHFSHDAKTLLMILQNAMQNENLLKGE
jgi:hypothetical protein